MTNIIAMAVWGVVSMGCAGITLYSGAQFKRAFDQYYKKEAPVSPEKVDVGDVNSVNQKGGVTAGYIKTVKQGGGD